MATKHFCDGCGEEIPKQKPDVGVGQPGDGLARVLVVSVGNGHVRAELCITCVDRTLALLAEAYPPSTAVIREYAANPYGLLGKVAGDPPPR